MISALNKQSLVFGFLGVFALTACAETELLVHTAKSIKTDTTPKPVGDYKVGNPYQIKGQWYYPAEDYQYVETGIASWYGEQFQGRPTSSGEPFDMNQLSGAHRTLPLPAWVRVTNLGNGRSVVLRINDRGPFADPDSRIIDVSYAAAIRLDMVQSGTASVRVEAIEPWQYRTAR